MHQGAADAEALLSTFGLLIRRLRAETSSYGYSLTERQVVARLARGGPTSIAELARAEGVRPQSMGATIAALEKAEIIERKAHPTDGRQFLIALSTKGHAVLENVRNAKRAWFEQELGKLSPSERQTIFAAGDIVARMLRP